MNKGMFSFPAGQTSSSVVSYPADKTVFSYTGADKSYTVPTGVTRLRVKLWGAGGGTGNQGAGSRDYPGGGGFVSGELDLQTLGINPGDVLTVVVGRGGPSNTAATVYGGGGSCVTSGVNAGCGGGRSAIRVNGIELVTAGAGGGTGNNANDQQSGGPGGGLSGMGAPSSGGQGGTQSAGGAAGGGTGGTAGSQFQGGNGDGTSGGGGGGGYYGGGGGGNAPGSGGGGSSFVANLVGTVVNTQASGYTAAGTTDADYVSGIGMGDTAPGVSGGNGRVVIY